MTIDSVRPPTTSPPSRRTAGRRLAAWLRVARPWQWHKNLLVFAAPAAAGLLDDTGILLQTALAAIAFTLAAAGTYFINDAVDATEDALHPVKCSRPIACGLVDRRRAVVVGFGLQALGVALALLTGVTSALVLLAYVGLTLGYSFRLKHVPVAEMLVVAAGFVLRAVAGGIASDVRISLWFLLVASAGALFLTVGKRAAELLLLGRHRSSHRRVLGFYTPTLLRSLLIGSGLLTLVSFSLWNVETQAAGMAMPWTAVSIVPLGVLLARYAWLAERGRGGEPELLLVRDPVLVVSGVTLATLLVGGLHLA